MKKRIVCFGDSNTWGYAPSDGQRYDEETRWTGRLQTLLGNGYTVIEEGQNGRTTVWDDPVENRMAGLSYLWPCMESQSPFDLLIIMLGTNDTKPRFNEGTGPIADAAGRLVDLAYKSDFGRSGKAPKVLLVSPIHIEPSKVYPYLFDERAARISYGFAAEFKRVADEYDCFYLDAAEYAEPSEIDGVHMSPEGHAALATAIADKVKSILTD